MAFGPRLQVSVPQKDGAPLTIELAPLSKEAMPEFVANGGMQSYLVTRYLARQIAPVLEDEYDWFEKIRKSDTYVVWGVWVRQPQGALKLIGNISLMSLEYGPTGLLQATDGILLFDQTFWGKGIASGIQKAVAWFAFTEMGITRIKAAVVHGNPGSLKALEKAGYTHVYEERNTAFVEGKLRHQDNLECINPLEPFWSTWWGDDTVPDVSLTARKLTLEVFDWAGQHVKLL